MQEIIGILGVIVKYGPDAVDAVKSIISTMKKSDPATAEMWQAALDIVMKDLHCED